MIILKFTDNIISKNNKRKRKTERVERASFIIDNKIFNIYTVPKSIINDRNIHRLINSNKGEIIALNSDSSIPKKFLYSPDNYFQRAIISTLIKLIKANKAEYKSVCVKTVDFNNADEFYELASVSKSLTLVTVANKNVEQFIKNCFVNYGMVVTRSDTVDKSYNIIINLDDIDDNAKLIGEFNGFSKLIYPNIEYFKVNESVEKLLNLGVPLPLACSVIYGNKALVK